jgi:hypothetical protein
MRTRRANAVWIGSLTEGNGTMRMASGAYEGPYSFESRFEDGDGTNPEELIAAAHAGCFSMALSGRPGFPLPAGSRSIEGVDIGRPGRVGRFPLRNGNEKRHSHAFMRSFVPSRHNRSYRGCSRAAPQSPY